MVKKALKFSFKAILFKLKVLGAFGFLWLFLFALFAWRISYSPWDITFAKDYVAGVLHDGATGNYVLMDHISVFWPDIRGPIYLEFQNARLLNKAGISLISVDEAAVSVSGLGLLQARVLPKSIILKGPSLRFLRTTDNQFRFDIGMVESDEVAQEQLELTTRIFSYIARPGKQAANKSLISLLEVFAIEDARVLVDDQIAQQTWTFPDFDMELYSTRRGLKGIIDLAMPDVGLKESGIRVDMDYIWDQKTVSVAADFESLDVKQIASRIPQLDALTDQNIVFNAHIETLLDENFNPADVRMSITSESGEIIHASLSDEPVSYGNLALNATYNYSGKTLKVSDASLNLGDVRFQAKAEIVQDEDSYKGPVKLWIDEVEHHNFIALWPKALEGENAEKWIVERMSGGVFKDVALGLEFIARKEESFVFSADNVVVSFVFSGSSLDYQAPLDVGTDLVGSGRYDLKSDVLTIDIDSGKIGKISAYDTKLVFNHIAEKGKGDADLSFGLRGQIPDMLRYIAQEPIGLNDIGLNPDEVTGTADLRVGLQFPTRKDVKKEEFEVSVKGDLKDIVFPDVHETLDLTGGPFKLNIEKGKVELNGKGMLESRDAELSYETFLRREGKPYVEKITAKIMADPNLRQMMGIDLSDFIQGSVFADVVYASYQDGSAKADVRADLKPALFFVEPFGYAKPSGEAASAHMSVYFKNKKVTRISNLDGEGEDFSFKKAFVDFTDVNGQREIAGGEFPSFTLDQNQGDLKFIYDERRVLNIDLNASILDARPFIKPAQGEGGDAEHYAMKISMQADKIITAQERSIREGSLQIDIDDKGVFSQWVFEAVAGQGKISARYQPDDQGKRNFTMRAEDAGALLKAFEIYDSMVGGLLEIKGVPKLNPQDLSLKGMARITGFHVIDAPIFARVLSLLSLQAIPDTGMAFTKLETDFEWLYASEGSVLKLKDGRTSGNSLGLLFEGRYDSARRFIDIAGTVVPMSGLNNAIGKIPLVGDILTGGSGGVFAATFNIKGSSDNPEVIANPLSVITPGILRRVLWE